MKTLLLTVLATCLSAASMQAETEMVYARYGEPFEMTGFVVGHDGGNCIPPKFAYQLVSTDHRNKVWLCAVDRNELALRRAMLSRGIYEVSGILRHDAERPYVEVESVRWY